MTEPSRSLQDDSLEADIRAALHVRADAYPVRRSNDPGAHLDRVSRRPSRSATGMAALALVAIAVVIALGVSLVRADPSPHVRPAETPPASAPDTPAPATAAPVISPPVTSAPATETPPAESPPAVPPPIDGPSADAPVTEVPPAASVVTARIELPADQMVAGSSMQATVVVTNDTGSDIGVVACGSWFQVRLAADGVNDQPGGIWAGCFMRITIPVGRTEYPVTLRAVYDQCFFDQEPLCGPDGTAPLPPGQYRAVFQQVSPIVAEPPTGTVLVTSS